MLGEIAVEDEDDDEGRVRLLLRRALLAPSFGFDKGARPSFLYPILMVSLEIL